LKEAKQVICLVSYHIPSSHLVRIPSKFRLSTLNWKPWHTEETDTEAAAVDAVTTSNIAGVVEVELGDGRPEHNLN
jgi:hypothetical protein